VSGNAFSETSTIWAMDKAPPPRPDEVSCVPVVRRTDTAEAILYMFGGLLLIGAVVMGPVGTIGAGDAGDLLRPRIFGTLLAFAGLGIGFLFLARALSERRAWARRPGMASFVLIGVAGAVCAVSALNINEGDGAGYLFLGGLSFVGAAVAGFLSVLRARS
jgi:drug/metabolite transporter (DMT)-like permease